MPIRDPKKLDYMGIVKASEDKYFSRSATSILEKIAEILDIMKNSETAKQIQRRELDYILGALDALNEETEYLEKYVVDFYIPPDWGEKKNYPS